MHKMFKKRINFILLRIINVYPVMVLTHIIMKIRKNALSAPSRTNILMILKMIVKIVLNQISIGMGLCV